MYRSKKELYAFTRKAYKYLREHPEKITVAKLRREKGLNVHGKYWPDSHEIVLDYRHDLFSTMIHELLHAFHPEWDEKNVLYHEDLIIRRITKRQVRNLLKAFADTL